MFKKDYKDNNYISFYEKENEYIDDSYISYNEEESEYKDEAFLKNYLNNKEINEDFYKKQNKQKVLEKLETFDNLKKIRLPSITPINSIFENDPYFNINLNDKNSDVTKEDMLEINVSPKKTKTNKLGRKRNNSKEKGKHNKYSGDNIIRRIKSTLITNLSLFINSVIIREYNGNIGQGIYRKEFLKMVQNQIINGKKDKEFLNKKLEDIFSEDISNKYTLLSYEHNKNLVQRLLNENDEIKKKLFKKLFNLSFLECLKHYRGSEYIEELQGLKTLKEELKNFEDDVEYLEVFKDYVLNFEEIIKKKKSRNTNHNK